MNEIGVILSVYNAENYLKACIESVLNQTLKEFKFYIIDDCSTDSSFKIINSFNDERIEIIRNSKNLGLTKSLNKIIKNVEEKYIARIDADDICLPERFKIQFDYLEQFRDVAFVGSSAFSINSEGEVIGEINVPIDNLKERLFFKNTFIHSSIMIRTDVIKEFQYDESLKYAQDYNLWVRIASQYSVSNLSTKLIKYRRHENNISANNKKEQDSYVVFTIINQLTSLGFKNDKILNKFAYKHLNYFVLGDELKRLNQQIFFIFYLKRIIKLNKKSYIYSSYFNNRVINLINFEIKNMRSIFNKLIRKMLKFIQ